MTGQGPSDPGGPQGARRWLYPRSYPTLVLVVFLGIVSVIFAWLSFNLAMLAMANVEFLSRHGVMAIMEGGLVQLSLITLKGFAALLAYLAFRGIEGEIMRRWTGRD